MSSSTSHESTNINTLFHTSTSLLNYQQIKPLVICSIMPNPDFILGLLRCAFRRGPGQNFNDEQIASLKQVGSYAETVSYWEEAFPKEQLDRVYSVLDMEKYKYWLNLPGSGKLLVHWTHYEKESATELEPEPEPELKGSKLSFQYTPLCALCDKMAQKLRFKEGHLVVQWNCEQIYSTDAGSPHAMLVGIIGQLFKQYDFEIWDSIMDLLVDTKRARYCSIETLTKLVQALIDQLPADKIVVVIIEGAALLDAKEFERFRGATLQTMRYLLKELITENISPRGKVKVLVASAPAPSWHTMFKPEETVQLKAPAQLPPPPSGLSELEIIEKFEDDDEELDVWNPRNYYLESCNKGSRWFWRNSMEVFVDRYRLFPYPFSKGVFS